MDTKSAKGSKGHLAVDVLGPSAGPPRHCGQRAEERAQVGELAAQVQELTGENVELAYVDQGYTGDERAQEAAAQGV
jgi:hypothetical protein